MASLEFPGRVLKKGDQGEATVRQIQRRLNGRGCGPINPNGVFGIETERAVKLFQARFPDVDGQPLVVDGKVGSITWAALFGEEPVPATETPPTPLLEKAITIARSQIGVMEQPAGSNRGPQVDDTSGGWGSAPQASSRGAPPSCTSASTKRLWAKGARIPL